MCQIGIRIQVIRNSGLVNAEHNCTGRGPLRRICKEEILPVYDEGFDAAFGKVIADFETTIIQIFRQLLAIVMEVGQCFTKLGCKR